MSVADLVPIPAVDDFIARSESVDLTADQAEAITARIRRWANSFPVEDVVRAFRGRIWIALAYDSWADWCECELGGLKLPIPQRREVVTELADQGMSNRAIADVVDVDHKTVGNDLSVVATGEFSPVDRKSLGQDGRERSYPHPKPNPPAPDPEVIDAEIVDPAEPEPKRRQRPLTDSAREIGMDLKNITSRMERLLADKRFARNKSEVAPHLRHYLTEVIKVCQDLNQHLN